MVKLPLGTPPILMCVYRSRPLPTMTFPLLRLSRINRIRIRKLIIYTNYRIVRAEKISLRRSLTTEPFLRSNHNSNLMRALILLFNLNSQLHNPTPKTSFQKLRTCNSMLSLLYRWVMSRDLSSQAKSRHKIRSKEQSQPSKGSRCQAFTSR